MLTFYQKLKITNSRLQLRTALWLLHTLHLLPANYFTVPRKPQEAYKIVELTIVWR